MIRNRKRSSAVLDDDVSSDDSSDGGSLLQDDALRVEEEARRRRRRDPMTTTTVPAAPPASTAKQEPAANEKEEEEGSNVRGKKNKHETKHMNNMSDDGEISGPPAPHPSMDQEDEENLQAAIALSLLQEQPSASDQSQKQKRNEKEVIDLCSSDDEDDTKNRSGDSAPPRAAAAAAAAPRSYSSAASALLSSFLANGMRDVWQPTLQSLDDWIATSRPSIPIHPACKWIQVHNHNESSPGYEDTNARRARAASFDRAAYQPALNRLQTIINSTGGGGRANATEKQACLDSILDTAATQQNLTTGKWLVRIPPPRADAVWERVARATAAGRLGCSAKILPVSPGNSNSGGDNVVCCVYVADFRQRRQVQRVLRELMSLVRGMSSPILGFKPDVLTHLGMNAGNPWRLKTAIYSVKEALGWELEQQE